MNIVITEHAVERFEQRFGDKDISKYATKALKRGSRLINTPEEIVIMYKKMRFVFICKNKIYTLITVTKPRANEHDEYSEEYWKQKGKNISKTPSYKKLNRQKHIIGDNYDNKGI